jgi:urea carboxylase-associated protein 2
MSTDDDTGTLEKARAHARAQAHAVSGARPELPDDVDASTVLWDEIVEAGGYASRVVPRDTTLRITDLDGDACVALLAHRAANTAERLNLADTVKVQWQAYLGTGSLLLSDMGRVLLTVVDDTSGRHDSLCGTSNRRLNDARYGDGSIWGPAPNGRDLLALAAAKHGLGRVDIAPAVNLFKGVRVGEDGSLAFDGDPRSGTHVDLRAEVDVLVLLAVTAHPLDPRATFSAGPVRTIAWTSVRAPIDPWRSSTPEGARAFENTDELRHGATA